MNRKLISLFLCGAMMLGSAVMLASCAEGKDKNTTANPGVVKPEGDRFLAKFPEGLTFTDLPEEERVLYVSYTEGGNGEFTRRSLKADDLDESDVDVATKARDVRLMEQLGLELEIQHAGSAMYDMESAIGNSLQAGAKDWDILAAYQFYGISLAQKGYLINLNDLASAGADYIDLDAPYWGKAFNENMSYKGAYYWISGDIALRYIGGMYCTFVNARIYNEKLEKEYGSIYDIAKKGQWTLDLMIEMASKCYADTGDIAGQKDEGDTFGYAYEPGTDIPDAIALGAGAQFTFRDPETGDITISINSPHTFDISKKLNTLSKKGNYSYQFPGNDNNNVMPAFAGGTIAFIVNKLFMAETFLSDMEDDYYIIPVAKYDETQKNYITGIHDGCTIFGITYCTDKVAQCAAALEFLCAYSSKDVAPLYYEGALKGRYTREPEAAEMIDLLHSSITTDFGIAWGESIDNIPHVFRSCDVLTQNVIKRKVDGYISSLEQLTADLELYVHGGEDPEA